MRMIRQSEKGKPSFGAVLLLTGDLVIPIINATVWKDFEKTGIATINIPHAQFVVFQNYAKVGA